MVKWLTRRIVAPLCVGSTPTTHPTGVSPSGKATDFDSVIRWFESTYPCQYDPLAQLVEHLTFNQGVPRSSRGWITTFFWPVGQVVKTPPSQGGIGGFKSPTGHHIHFNLGEQFYTRPVGQVVKTPPFHGGIGGSNPPRVTILYGRLAQLGERLPYKQDVGSSILSSPTI